MGISPTYDLSKYFINDVPIVVRLSTVTLKILPCGKQNTIGEGTSEGGTHPLPEDFFLSRKKDWMNTGGPSGCTTEKMPYLQVISEDFLS